MNPRLLCFIIFLSLCTSRIYGYDRTEALHGGSDRPLSLAKNEGQWESVIEYKAFLPGGAIFLTREGFTYSFYSIDDVNKLHDQRLKEGKDISQAPVKMHAYKMLFEGANKNSALVADDKKEFYYSYFLGNDKRRWKSKVPVFNRVTYKDIYMGVDLIVYSSPEASFKYDLVVTDHDKAKNIVLSFEGVEPTITKTGSLKILTSIGEINESAPYSYQVINGVRKEVKSKYRMVGKSKIGFELGDHDPNYPVVIDPVLVFATYSGSTALTYGFCATYDNKGDLIDAGEVFNVGWPVQMGAFQMNFGGAVDMGINRFNASGTMLLHSTYLGGSRQDQPTSLICDENMELYVMSVTQSSNFPVTTGCFDNTHNGQLDFAVTHLDNSFSSLLGSTLLGGSGDDGSFNPKGEIYLDSLKNIIVGAYTTSTDYPVSIGALQASYGGGAEDGVVSILNNNCSNLTSSTYLGGSGEDRITGIRKMPNGFIAVTGRSNSKDYPVTPLAYQTAPGPASNGVLSVLSPTLLSTIASTYVHSPSNDPNDFTTLQFVDFDNQNNLYVYGSTDTTFPISPGKYSNKYGRTLIAKFPQALNTLIWATRIGASNNGSILPLSPTAFLTDVCGKIYMAGYGGSMPSYPLTANALSTTANGFWIGVLETNATNLLFGTFFGTQGDHLDGGTSRFDKKGIIYHAVCCGNANFPVTPNAAFPTRSTPGFDIVGYKLDSETQSVVAMASASPGLVSCSAPFTVSFTNGSQNGATYFWDFGDGNTSMAPQPTHTYVTPGVFNVMMIASNPAACNFHDTVSLTVQILNDSFALVNNDTSVCFQNGFVPMTLTAQVKGSTSNVRYTWLPNNAIISGTTSRSILVDLTIDSVFIVIAVDSIPGLCSKSDTDTIVVRAVEIGNYYALPDTTIRFCIGQSFKLSATGASTTYYEWKDLSGSGTIAGVYSATPIITPLQTTEYVVFIYDSPKKICFITDTVRVERRPNFDVESSPVYACIGDTVLLNVKVSPNDIPFDVHWEHIGGGGSSHFISGQHTLSPMVYASTDADYVVSIVTSDSNYCESTDTVQIRLHPIINLEAGQDEIIRYGTSIQLQARGSGEFTWTPADYLSNAHISNPVASPPNDITYYITVVNAAGCKETDSLKIQVTNSSLPTAFSPNGDGRNDVLKILRPNDLGKLREFRIYDRWGNQVFFTQDANEGWDGRYKDEPADMGVYFYSLIYTIGKNTYHDKGDVSLVR